MLETCRKNTFAYPLVHRVPGVPASLGPVTQSLILVITQASFLKSVRTPEIGNELQTPRDVSARDLVGPGSVALKRRGLYPGNLLT
eukprot:3101421-Rhodomonas_salina.1